MTQILIRVYTAGLKPQRTELCLSSIHCGVLSCKQSYQLQGTLPCKDFIKGTPVLTESQKIKRIFKRGAYGIRNNSQITPTELAHSRYLYWMQTLHLTQPTPDTGYSKTAIGIAASEVSQSPKWLPSHPHPPPPILHVTCF